MLQVQVNGHHGFRMPSINVASCGTLVGPRRSPRPPFVMKNPAGDVNIRTVAILANMVFFVFGFNHSFFNALVPPLVERSITSQYGESYAKQHFGKFSFVLTAVINICGGIANPIFGQISDRSGRRSIMLISLLSATLCLIGFATFKLYWSLLIIRIVTGLFDSSQFMGKVVIGDIATPETQKKLFSELYSWFAVCLTAGPFLVSIFEGTEGDWKSSGPCLIAASIAFICFVANYAYLPETRSQQSLQKGCNLSWYQALSNAKLAIPIWAYGVLSMALAAGETFTALFIVESRGGLALPPANIGRLFAIQGAAYCLTQALFSSHLLRRYGNLVMFRVTLVAMVVLYPATFLAAYVPYKFVTIAIIMCLRVFASSIAVAAINLIINKKGAEADALGSVAAVAQAICGVLKTISLFVIGIIYDISAGHGTLYVPLILIAFIFLLTLALSFITYGQKITSNQSCIKELDRT